MASSLCGILVHRRFMARFQSRDFISGDTRLRASQASLWGDTVGGCMLKQRVVTAAIGVLVIFSILVFGTNLPWHIVVWICTLLGMAEFSTMFGFSWKNPLGIYGVVLVSVMEWWPHISVVYLAYSVIAICLLWPVVAKNKVTVTQAATITVGAVYIGYGGVSLAMLRALPHGAVWVWLCLICIWLTDTAAFFVGRALKGPKLWPAISPQKTISGALGGILGAALGAVVFGYTMVRNFDPLAYAVTGAVISIA